MSLIKKLAGETVIYGLSSIIGRVVNWGILTSFLTRELSTREFGVKSELYAYVAVLLVFFTCRLDTALFRFGSRTKTEQNNYNADDAFKTASLGVVGLVTFLGFFLLFFAPEVANFLSFSGRIYYVRLFGLIVIFDALATVPYARLRLENRPVRFASLKIISILTNIILLFFFLKGCPYLIDKGYENFSSIYDPERKIAYIFIANLIASGLTLLWLSPLYKKNAGKFIKNLWRLMMRYSLPLVIASLAALINQLGGVVFLKQFGIGSIAENEATAGIYAAATALAVIMSLFIQAFNYAAEPFFFKQAAASNDKQIYADVARAFALVGSFAFVGIMFYLDLIQYFLGKDFRVGLGILPILLVSNFFLGLFYNFAMSYKLTDKTIWGGYIAIVGAIITIALNYLLIPSLSYYAPAWASFSCYLVMTVLAYFLSRKLWPVDYAIGRMLYYLCWALGLWGISLLIRPFLGEQLWTIIAVNTSILLLGLGVLYKTEWSWLKKVLSTA